VVEDDGVTFNLMGHTYELTNTFVAAAIGTVANRSGNLTVTNGTLKLPTAADLEIASVANGKGVLTVGAGGSIGPANNRPELKVGLNGDGTLEIISGGIVVANQVTLGVSSGSNGTVKVTGNGSSLHIVGGLDMRGAGSGTLRIETGGFVSVGDLQLGGNDELHLEGGRLYAGSVNSPGFFWTSGTFSFVQFSDDLTIPNGCVLDSIPSSPGHVIGSLTLLPGATTRVGKGSLGFGQIQVDGHVVLGGGNLQLSGSGFMPSSPIEIITTGLGISGSFANVANGQRLAVGDGSFLVNYGPGSPFDPKSVFISSFQPATPGDFDVDGDVDGNDFLVWQRGDSPNHGNAADLVAWRVNFGISGAAAVSSAVPESTAATLTIVAATAALVVSGRRQPNARKP